MSYFKYLDVDVVSVLEEKMDSNTRYYRSDFEIDKDMIRRYILSDLPEHHTLLWLSRPAGTQCNTEHEAFIKGSEAHSTWLYHLGHKNVPMLACAVELTAIRDGVVFGNVYELDTQALLADISSKSIDSSEVEKTFEDGFVHRVSVGSSCYGYWSGLVDEHGAIVSSRTIPYDHEALDLVLSQQKKNRDRLPVKKHLSLAKKIFMAQEKRNCSDKNGPTTKNASKTKEFS